MLIRAATSDDVPTIVSLIVANARKGGLLPRSEASIRASLHNFLVAQLEAEDSSQLSVPSIQNFEPIAGNLELGTSNLRVVGCGSLMPMNTTLVELRSLAVDETLRGLGIGQKMVAALVDEARARKFGTIFALTRAVSFFERCGFVITPKENFPEKVWRDCVACPLLAHCDEVAVTMTLTEQIEPASNGGAPQAERKATIQPPFQNQFKQTTKKRMSNKPEVNKVVLAYSGGLDTSVIVPWLIENYHCEVVCFVADIGQGDDFDAIKHKALKSGASKCIVRDLRDEFANEYLFPMVQSGAIYEGKYLFGSAISRPLIAKHQVELAAQESADAVAHGATGRGNDQVRFELSYMALNPRLKIIAPWREWNFTGREDLLAYAKKLKISVPPMAKDYGTHDANLWHVSHEGGTMEDPSHEPDVKMFQFTTSPEDAPDKAEYVEIDFVSGIPKRINGKGLSGADLIALLNEYGSRHGIGRADLVENRLVGMKSHGVYETPGGTILREAHAGLEQLTLDRETTHFKQIAALKYADLVYNGQWFTPLRDALQAFVAVTQRDVTGSVRIKLYKGNATVVGRTANYSLYREDLATFQREDIYNHSDASGFIRLYGLPLRVKAQVDLNRAAFAPPVANSNSGKRD